MKKPLPLLAFLICMTLFVNAQNDSLEHSIQLGHYTNFSCAKKEYPSQSFYIGLAATDSLGFAIQPYLIKLADSGAAMWQTEAFDTVYQTGEINELLQAYDNNIVISGYEQQCNIHKGKGYVQKIGRSSGNIIWLKSFELDYGSGFGNDIVELPDSGFWVSNKNMLYRLDKNGDSLNYITYAFGKINVMLMTAPNSILLGCKNGLVKIDTAGNVLDTLGFPKPVTLMTNAQDSLYFILSGKIIYKTDSALNILAQDNSWINAIEINKIEVENNMLWTLLHPGANNISRLLKWDLDFNFIGFNDFSNFNGSDLDARSININTQDYNLFIHERTNKLSNHVLIKNWDKANNATISHNIDVGVTGFSADSSYADIKVVGGQTILTPYFNIVVNVKNYGQVTVNDFFLNSVLDTTLNVCLPHTFGKQFTGLNILPGDSLNIHIGIVEGEKYEALSNPTNERYLCFWTSTPNSMMDYDHGNDNNCQILYVTNFTGINDSYANSNFSLMPNPAENELTIKGTSLVNIYNSEITIYNLLGEPVIRKNMIETNIKLDVSKLIAGIYLVKIETGTNVYSRKFVKQ